MTDRPAIDPTTFYTSSDEPMLQAIRDQSEAITSPDLLNSELLENQLQQQESARRIAHPRMLASMEWQNDIVRSVCFGLFERFEDDFVRLVPMKYPVQPYMLPNDTYVSILAERFPVGRFDNNVPTLAKRIVGIMVGMVRTFREAERVRPVVGVAILPYIVVATSFSDERQVDTRFGYYAIHQDDLPTSEVRDEEPTKDQSEDSDRDDA